MKSFLMFFFLLALIPATVRAAGIPNGYAGIPWGTDSHKIVKTYTNGTMGRMGEQLIYKQLQPNKEMRQRTFAFRDNKLVAVSVSFSAPYVKKTGLEKLLGLHQKAYGSGIMDRTNAPHLVSYIWENRTSKITFAYAPKKPEFTILMFQQK